MTGMTFESIIQRVGKFQSTFRLLHSNELFVANCFQPRPLMN